MVMKLSDRLKVEIEKLKNDLDTMESELDARLAENRRLRALIRDDEKPDRIFSDMRAEIDVLRSQSATWQEKYEHCRRSLYMARKAGKGHGK